MSYYSIFFITFFNLNFCLDYSTHLKFYIHFLAILIVFLMFLLSLLIFIIYANQQYLKKYFLQHWKNIFKYILHTVMSFYHFFINIICKLYMYMWSWSQRLRQKCFIPLCMKRKLQKTLVFLSSHRDEICSYLYVRYTARTAVKRKLATGCNTLSMSV